MGKEGMDVGGQLTICHTRQNRRSGKTFCVDPESKRLKRHLVARYLNFRIQAGKTDSKKVEFSNIIIVTSRNHMLLREKHLLKRLSSHEDRHLVLLLEHECASFLNSCLGVSRSVIQERMGLF